MTAIAPAVEKLIARGVLEPDALPLLRRIYGVAVGGRSGFTAVVAGVLFIAALFAAPVVEVIPAAATAPALIIGLTAMIAGRIVDRLGRKRLLVGALVAYAFVGTAPLWLPSLQLIVAVAATTAPSFAKRSSFITISVVPSTPTRGGGPSSLARPGANPPATR